MGRMLSGTCAYTTFPFFPYAYIRLVLPLESDEGNQLPTNSSQHTHNIITTPSEPVSPYRGPSINEASNLPRPDDIAIASTPASAVAPTPPAPRNPSPIFYEDDLPGSVPASISQLSMQDADDPRY